MADLNNLLNLSEKLSGIHNIPQLPEIDTRNYFLADYQYELLCDYIKQFQDELDDEHEIALMLASFGQSITLNVTHIGYSNPSIIDFYGYCNGNKAHLIQHINQLNFLIILYLNLTQKNQHEELDFKLVLQMRTSFTLT